MTSQAPTEINAICPPDRAQRVGGGNVGAIESLPLVRGPRRQARICRPQGLRQPPDDSALARPRLLLRQARNARSLSECRQREEQGADGGHGAHDRMQKHERRQDDRQPWRIERGNDGPVGKRTRQEGERVGVFPDLSRWCSEPRAVREHVLAERVLQPKPGSEQDTIAHRGKADEGRAGRSGNEGQQGELQQAGKAIQHEGRDKRAPYLLQEFPRRVHSRLARTFDAALREGASPGSNVSPGPKGSAKRPLTHAPELRGAARPPSFLPL
jgi:hypothetical protein